MAMERSLIRKSVIAGSWYPGEPTVLRNTIEDFLAAVPKQIQPKHLYGVVVPHAGYVYSGQVAAYAYRLVRGRAYDVVIVVSPSHRQHFPSVAVYDRGGYETPLGIIPIAEDLAAKLVKLSTVIEANRSAHLYEHALEIQLPFLQVVLGSFSLVPLMMGDQDAQTCRELAEAIHTATKGKDVLVVGSSDLSHFHSYDRAVSLDRFFLHHMQQMDPEGLLLDLEVGKTEACGGGPAVVALMASTAAGANRSAVLKYANSGDVTGERQRVVGYASVALYAD
jgi:hypothetical protein